MGRKNSYGMYRILVIDDSKMLRNLVVNLLKDLGFKNVYQTGGAKKVIATLLDWKKEGNPCLLIITDINMPGMSGIELLDGIKKHSLLGDIPVMMMTSEKDESTILSAAASGASQYITKPVKKEVIEERVFKVFKEFYPIKVYDY